MFLRVRIEGTLFDNYVDQLEIAENQHMAIGIQFCKVKVF